MRKVFATLNALLMLGYPLVVYLGLMRFGARVVGLSMLALLLLGLGVRWGAASRDAVSGLLRAPLIVMALMALSAALDDPRFVLALPVLINAVLLAQFAHSLRGTPMVERFARMQDPNLEPARLAYCRTVTVVWCWFFVSNGLVSLYLALYAPVALWALYTGLIAYLLIGALAAGEYLVRKLRFRDYGLTLHDRLIMRVFPPRSGNGEAPP
jgi:uncharacterized membrane protein